MKFCIIVILCLVLCQYHQVDADCNECNKVHACVSSKSFSVCFEKNTPSKKIVTCPKGTVCTSGVKICEKNKEPDCKRAKVKPKSKCGVCEEENHVFACLGENVVAFCYGQTRPFYSSLVTCPEGTVCDLNNKDGICSPKEEVWPSCYINEENNEHVERSIEHEVNGGRCTADLGTETTTMEAHTDVTVSTNRIEHFEMEEGAETTQKQTKATTLPTTTKATTEEDTTTEQETTTTEEETTTTEQETTTTEEDTTTTEEDTTTTEEDTTTTEEDTTTTEEETTTTEQETTTTEQETTTTEEEITTTKGTTIITTTEDSPRAFPPNPKDNYRYYCGTKRLEAIYANIYDPTCETFIYCVQQNKEWFGVEMYCDDEYRYFDPKLNKCQPKKPAHCH